MRRIILVLGGALMMGLMPVNASLAGEVRDQAAGPAPRIGIGIIVPAYWYQGTASWQVLATTPNPPLKGDRKARLIGEAIFNPCGPHGGRCSPGTAVNKAALKDLRAAEANHIVFYGYIWTHGGEVPAGTVEKKIGEYESWYGLRDIFLDGVATSCAIERRYYRPLYRYVHSRHGKVILNPGTQPPACYLRAGDQINVFDNPGARFAAYRPAPWMAGYPAARFTAIVYAASGTAAMAAVVGRAGHRDHIGSVYVTSLGSPNPFAKLPAYWRPEVSKASGTYSR